MGNEFFNSLLVLPEGKEVQIFNLLPRPGCLAQKFQTRFQGRVVGETADFDAPAQSIPTVVFGQTLDYVFESLAVKRIVGLRIDHGNEILSRKHAIDFVRAVSIIDREVVVKVVV